MGDISATLLYTATLVHPTDPERHLLELEVAAEIEWFSDWEGHFTIGDIYFYEDVIRNGVWWRKHLPLPSEIQAWVRSCIERDRSWIAKGIDEGVEDGVVTPPRTDGGRLTLPDPF